ncbi:MAG: tRNA(adenine34) deaminase [Epulopiscium sp.]|jgi:tRNA(adenine34) deaminase|uniref:tRNA-specific adenosine deaminase n=1 Tax=Defluviitalea raffinosedens TaxID=1450156 RepID=A0A7C8LGJ8_9FIRM|nr:tRNA adenosine(34) deaminase TadA [Defluviitalea raffinosedens]MBZ4669078.1 Cytosine/adenosine deaminase [Defluviitaleaceae bacterium]MDK2786994.1 tRNA(adenine34) deaminase [Candidatus Epulonipiscium sp.]KAE9630218.1 tRNA-specific adenosine deaminase [Defluviitalea raffinosedens]MBM7686021.1 tRNA(adenine34) deaminase [Defluviitalea raffinosedens]HHW67732.1 nucleoside deaminase [Candidatus Epulonipiscium sp.]
MEDLEIYYMKEALLLAKKAFQLDEVPIGAIITYNNQIIGRGYNQRNTKKNPLSHAEIQAIEEAAVYLGDWRLEGCTMYVTLEPCPMCAGAIVQARMDKVVFGTRNPKAGCGGSILNILQEKAFNHQVEIVEGVCMEECSSILKEFFSKMRLKRE